MSLLEYLSKSYLAEQASQKPAQPVDPSHSLLAVPFGSEIRLYNLFEETYSDLTLESEPAPKTKKKKKATGGVASYSYDTSYVSWTPPLQIYKIGFDPTGRYLGAFYSGGSLVAWDVVTGHRLPFPGEAPSVGLRDFWFSPDGNQLFCRTEVGVDIFSFPSLVINRTVILSDLCQDLANLPYYRPLLMLNGAMGLIQGHSGLHLLNLSTLTDQLVFPAPFVSSHCQLLRMASGQFLYVDHSGVKRLDADFVIQAYRERSVGYPVTNPAWDMFCYTNLETSSLTVLDSQTFENEFTIPDSSGFTMPKFSADGYHLLYYSESTGEIQIRDIRDPSCKTIGIIRLPSHPSCPFDIQPQLAFST